MEIPCAQSQRLTYNARCRQMRALAGDCFHFVSLPGALGSPSPMRPVMASLQRSS